MKFEAAVAKVDRHSHQVDIIFAEVDQGLASRVDEPSKDKHRELPGTIESLARGLIRSIDCRYQQATARKQIMR